MRTWLLSTLVVVMACDGGSEGDMAADDLTSADSFADGGPGEADASQSVADAGPAADATGPDATVVVVAPDAAPPVDPCNHNGTLLYGKVRVVENFVVGEIKVAYVSSFPDLKVQFTNFDSQATSCGIWHQDNVFYDFTIREVDPVTGFPDLKIKDVTGTAERPGL